MWATMIMSLMFWAACAVLDKGLYNRPGQLEYTRLNDGSVLKPLQEDSIICNVFPEGGKEEVAFSRVMNVQTAWFSAA